MSVFKQNQLLLLFSFLYIIITLNILISGGHDDDSSLDNMRNKKYLRFTSPLRTHNFNLQNLQTFHRINQIKQRHRFHENNACLNKRTYSNDPHLLFLQNDLFKLLKGKRRMMINHDDLLVDQLLKSEITKLRGWRPQRYG
ncbi:unnamed protein product [Schistosoma turkestanicum]|nr:unnamed protein product [Schistosoma turkestanicum]